ncbi:MAG: ATP-dependent helicase/nuclease subunit A [Chlamydiales bacterium]|jgi:ATP-dependent helicase/nuclease subunit A
MNGLGNELLLASAGTGKTYRLTNQFLRLLLAGVEPERVLATTFTRKAAGEILDRVLERLVNAADNVEGLENLQEALERPASGPDALTSEHCSALLIRLTRALDTFQVRTLDSFFAHLVRIFAHDLELPPNWSIADEREDDGLRAGAIQDVMENVEHHEMLELLRDLQKGGASRGVQATLLARTQALRSIAIESTEGAWSVLRRDTSADASAYAQAVAALARVPLATTKKGAEVVNWVKSRDKILRDLEGENWGDVFTKGLGLASLKEEPMFCKHELEPDMLGALEPIVARAKAEVLNQLVARNEALHTLLQRFEERYAQRKRDAGRYGFDDLPMALAPRTARAQLFDEREAELWFRLDGRIDHLLLDEFQDTAPIQWRILAPLASEITSSGDGERSFFCVGDPKQSIYGFRQAEPRLLQNLHKLLPGLEVEAMDKSYRSSSIVLELVNIVFGSLESNRALAGADLGPIQRAADEWGARFSTHHSALKIPGAVQVVEAEEPAEGESKHLANLRSAVERVVQIQAQAPHVEIGVLTRVNKNIPFLIHALRQKGIDASGEGGNPLTDSEAVLVYMSLLHLADHPSDSAAAFHVMTSRLGSYIDLPLEADRDAVRAKARWFRGELLRRGLGATTEALAARINADPEWSAWDKTRFAQLVDQAHAFEPRMSLRASEFVDHLRSTRVEAPGGARVRIMTVHASKGLEFDAVVLPELQGLLVSKRDEYLAYRPDPTGLIEAVMLSPGKDLLSLSPELEVLYDQATGKIVEDSLCNLYVAMTRAKSRLELILPWRDPEHDDTDKAPTFAAVIRAALPAAELLEEDPDGVLWRSSKNASEGTWAADAGDESTGASGPGEPERELVLAPSKAPRFTRRGAASRKDAGTTLAAVDLLSSGIGARVGTLVHAIFERCEWIEDFEFADSQLEGHGATREVIAVARKIVESALDSKEIRSALSRAGCAAPTGADLRVQQEHAFSMFLDNDSGQPTFWNGAIDRLVIAEENGQATWAEIIDYKSDAVSEANLASHAEDYRSQLEAYARVVSAQTGLAADRIRLRLAFLSAGRVIDIT